MREPDKGDLELTIRWIQSKGVGVWPSIPWGDTQDPKEAELLARWFLDQAADLNEFYHEHGPF